MSIDVSRIDDTSQRDLSPRHREADRPWRSMLACQGGLPRRLRLFAMTATSVANSRTLNRFFATLMRALGLTALSVAVKAEDSGELTVRAQGFKHAGGPLKALGFSGGFVLSWVSGRPDFERLQFEFKPPAQTLEVRLQ